MTKKRQAAAAARPERITIGISTSALFDMREADKIYRTKGVKAYEDYMIKREDQPFAPGHAFELVKTICDINNTLGHTLFDFVIISRNDMWTGARAVRSCYHHDLAFSGAMFSNGAPVADYLAAYNVDWLISTNKDDVEAAVKAGIAANTIDSPLHPAEALDKARTIKAAQSAAPQSPANQNDPSLSHQFNRKLHIVWDLDRVVLGGESDDIFGEKGADYYMHHERTNADQEISNGPFHRIARLLGEASKHFGENTPIVSSGLTARGGPSALRAMLSLRKKGIVFNGALHMTGGGVLEGGKIVAKGIYKDKVLEVMKREQSHAILFLDDSERTIDMTRNVVASGLVPRDAGGIAIGEEKKVPNTKPQPK